MKKTAVVLAGIWLGMQLAAGYLAAPLLFKSLPKLQAGVIAGELFTTVAYLGLAVWAFVYAVGKSGLETRRSLLTGSCIVLLWAGLAVNQFLITPVIEAHKTGKHNWLLSLTGGSFGMWHGISSLIYLLCSVLAALAVWRISAFDRQA